MLTGLAFLPIYIRYFGMEAYGLVGFFAVFQAGLSLLDFGMTSVLTRETARMRSGSVSAQEVRDLLRGTELLLAGTSLIALLAVWASAGWLARHWLRVGGLPTSTVSTAILLMGMVACTRCLDVCPTSAFATSTARAGPSSCRAPKTGISPMRISC